jgi:hypothetical protein
MVERDNPMTFVRPNPVMSLGFCALGADTPLRGGKDGRRAGVILF